MSELTQLKRPDEKWWLADCDACDEKALAHYEAGPCPYCGEEGQVKFTPDPTPRAVEAQEEVVSALWKLGEAGPPRDENGKTRQEFVTAVSPALERIMTAFGYVVTPIQ